MGLSIYTEGFANKGSQVLKFSLPFNLIGLYPLIW
jgi:hypothetical protein